jgi:hypothetical protein
LSWPYIMLVLAVLVAALYGLMLGLVDPGLWARLLRRLRWH